MSETWFVTASDEAKNPLYTGQMSVESDDVTVSAPAAALQAACDRLSAVGIDPRIVKYWHLSQREEPKPGVNA